MLETFLRLVCDSLYTADVGDIYQFSTNCLDTSNMTTFINDII